MHLFDVEEAVIQANLPALRQAFAILIDYPHRGHVEGARMPAKLADLFDQVTLALELDHAVMPEQLCRTISRVSSVPVETTASFAHGAIIALEFSERWRDVFRSHAGLSQAA